jgi:hypothetical protein
MALSHPSLVASRRHLLVVLAALVLNAGRSWLQTQFTGLTNSHSIGILASAVGFGAAHLYQRLARASVIAASAVLYGLVVKWRRSVRPGMFATPYRTPSHRRWSD